MKLTNRSDGPRGINTTEGLVVLPRGATWEGKLAKGELKTLEKSWFEKDGEDEADDEEETSDADEETPDDEETTDETEGTASGSARSRRNRR